MIDLQEAERIARTYSLEHVGKELLTSTIERPFGWVFHFQVPDCIPGFIKLAVERETGRLSQLGTSSPSDITITWFEEELHWRSMHDSALSEISPPDFSKAEAALLKSLSFAQELAAQRLGSMADDATIKMTIVSMTSLGRIYMQAGDLQHAESTFLQAKSIIDELVPLKRSGRPEQRAPLLNNLIEFYRLKQLRFDADIVRRELALAYYMDWKFGKAQELFEELLQKRSEIYLDNHPRIAQILTDLANIKNAQQQYYLAGLYFEKSVRIWDWLSENPQRLSEFVEAKHHTSVAEFQAMFVATLDAYGRFLSQRPGKSDEAASVKKRAIELKQLLV